MLRRMEVLSRVPILRVVATTDMPAGSAESQMNPGIAELEALLATATTRLIGPHETQMTALLSHETRNVEPVRDQKRWQRRTHCTQTPSLCRYSFSSVQG